MNIPNIFKCPISQLIYNNPVIGSDGNCYEYDMINKWLSINSKSPITRKLMQRTFCKNKQLKERIKNFIKINTKYIDPNYVYNYDIMIINFIKNSNDVILKKITTFDWSCLKNLESWENYLLKLNNDTIEHFVKIGINKNNIIKVIHPIHFLCKYYNEDIIKTAINNGYNLELSYNSWRPIHYVINYNKNIEVLRLLINAKVNLETELFNKMRPIHLACTKHKINFMRLLLEEDVDINTPFIYNNYAYKNLRVFIVKNSTDLEQEKKEINLIYYYKIK